MYFPYLQYTCTSIISLYDMSHMSLQLFTSFRIDFLYCTTYPYTIITFFFLYFNFGHLKLMKRDKGEGGLMK